MSRPGARQTIPLPIHQVPQLDDDTIGAALAMLDHWGAMDVAPMLGLAPAPPKPTKPRCECGECRNCRDRAPWQCPRCPLVVTQGSAARHLKRHGEGR